MRINSSPSFQTWACLSFSAICFLVTSVSREFRPGETDLNRKLFLFAGGLFGARGGLLGCGQVAGLGLFLVGFLLRGLRGFVAHNGDV